MKSFSPTRRSALHCSLGALLAVLAPSALARAAAAAPYKGPVLVLGDSLSAEYGLARGSGWVELLRQRLAHEKIDTAVVNASISGETTSGGVSRLPALLEQHKPGVLVIELGGNDALRGLPLSMTRANLTTLARLGREAGARVMLIGMQVPPNYGRRYADDFAAVFVDVARTAHTSLVPFLLEGIADAGDQASLFQADRIHPTAQAQPRMLDNVWPVLAPLLR